ncbi:hypothetical protein Tco_1164374, partial [Tanacetum coccineum]
DSLQKTIWFINAPCYGNEALASPKANELTIPEQTATGKGTSNPFMAGSLPKTTKTNMLNKLEADVFPKDDGGDTDVGKEAKLEVSDEEQVLEEDDVEEDYYSVGVPTNLEGRKKYVSAFLKKAGELVEMADEVLDKGLENNLTDSGFIELKELRNQLFEVPTTDEKEEDDPTNFSFHTPDDGGKQYPITQVYGSPTGYRELQDKVWEEWHRQAGHILTRLNFDEVDDINLNVTQPPATQGKVVGGAEDENNMEEDESLLDALINYVSQETKDEDEFFTPDQTIGVPEKESKMSRFGTDSNAMLDSKAMVPAFSQPKPLNVLLGNIPYGRPRRNVVIPEVLHSPYVVREVSLICGISPHEKRAANCWEYEKASKKFNENMEDVLNNSLYKTLKGVDLPMTDAYGLCIVMNSNSAIVCSHANLSRIGQMHSLSPMNVSTSETDITSDRAISFLILSN